MIVILGILSMRSLARAFGWCRATVLRISFLLVLLLLLTGCGANHFSPSQPNGFMSSSSVAVNAALAECNNISAPSINLVGQISTYYDPTSHQLVPTALLVNLTSVPAALFTSSTVSIEVFNYSETVMGVKTYNTSPVPISFLDKLTGLTTPTYSSLSLTNIKAAFKALSLPSSVTTSEFFDRVYVVLLGMDASYDAATFAYYDTNVSTSAQAQGSVILPPFYANPTIYQSYKTVADLVSLHPFYAYMGSGGTDAEFVSMDEQICAAMSVGGNRIPASVGSAILPMAISKGFLRNPLGARAAYHELGFFARIWSTYFAAIWGHIVQSLAVMPVFGGR